MKPLESQQQSWQKHKGKIAFLWGQAAEQQIIQHYTAQGGHLLACRAQTEAGEIDLILTVQDILVFVEVRARRTIEQALHSVTPAKLQRVMAAAECYLASMDQPDTACRIDIAALDRAGHIEIVENITG